MSNEHPTPPHQPPAPGPYGPPVPPSAPGPYGPPVPPPGPAAHGGQPHGQAPAAPAPHPPYPAPPPAPQGGTPYAPPHPDPSWPQYQPQPQPPYASPSPYPPQFQAQPPAMPGPVRAAQIVIFATTGLAVLLTVLVAVAAGAEASGRFFATYLMSAVLCVLAFRYPTAGNGVRVTSLVLASVQILFALGATARGVPLGILPLGSAVAVVVLLSQGSAGQWFRRHRTNAVPPPHF
ncbi:hypothetical protein CD934_11610 [Streptomyces calvus]|uniref:Uncharacterized protein n=1 Tax=Streptomyces calvus TaxID=67282 RepID=A0A514JPL4_9ACTN|nr:hypothetical protein [Streptomyces calvus]QDI69276.1 hypothetical protein CD934_11610 [Streptomyces calvus]